MSSTRPTQRSTSERAQQAFSETVDPAAYVSRDATEEILARLQAWTRADGDESTVAALVASPGLGKTFLLRLFESRFGRPMAGAEGLPRTLYLPYAGLSIIDLCVWIHGLLGRGIRLPETGANSGAALEALCALAPDAQNPFILLVDDADSMPQETIRALVEGLPRTLSPLRLLIALNDDAKASRLLASLDTFHPLLLPLGPPMSEAETARYLAGRMRWAAFDAEEIARWNPAVLRKIHGLSGGVPRQVHRIAASIFEARAKGRPLELDQKDRRENWMGQPIEDEF